MANVSTDFFFRQSKCLNTALRKVCIPRIINGLSGFVPVSTVAFNGEIVGRNKEVCVKRANAILWNKGNAAFGEQSHDGSFNAGRGMFEVAGRRAEVVFHVDFGVPSDKGFSASIANNLAPFFSSFIETSGRAVLPSYIAGMNSEHRSTVRARFIFRAAFPKVALLAQKLERGVARLGAKERAYRVNWVNKVFLSASRAGLGYFAAPPVIGGFPMTITRSTRSGAVKGSFGAVRMHLVRLSAIFTSLVNHGFHTMNYTMNLQ